MTILHHHQTHPVGVPVVLLQVDSTFPPTPLTLPTLNLLEKEPIFFCCQEKVYFEVSPDGTEMAWSLLGVQTVQSRVA